jgi:hypothetical protein
MTLMKNFQKDQLTQLCSSIKIDNRLHATHMSLYAALLIIWSTNNFTNPFTASRAELMTISKLGSTATYHRCIKDLNNFGYIMYKPTFNSFIGTQFKILKVQQSRSVILP